MVKIVFSDDRKEDIVFNDGFRSRATVRYESEWCIVNDCDGRDHAFFGGNIEECVYEHERF